MTTMERAQVLEKVREAREAGRRADLTDADLTDADLSDADLTGADLTYAELRGAELRGATLTDAILTRANLIGADLRGADLTGAVLTNAWLEGANLTTKQLLDAKGLRPGASELHRGTWDELLPINPQRRQLVEHLLNDGWNGTLREAIATVEGLAGR